MGVKLKGEWQEVKPPLSQSGRWEDGFKVLGTEGASAILTSLSDRRGDHHLYLAITAVRTQQSLVGLGVLINTDRTLQQLGHHLRWTSRLESLPNPHCSVVCFCFMC